MFPATELSTVALWWEEPNLLHSRLTTTGKVDAKSMRGLYEIIGDVHARQKNFYWVLDLSNATGVDAEAREIIRKEDGVWEYQGLVLVGGSALMRAVATMIFRGMYLLGRFRPRVASVKTLAEAKEWIAEDMRKHRPNDS